MSPRESYKVGKIAPVAVCFPRSAPGRRRLVIALVYSCPFMSTSMNGGGGYSRDQRRSQLRSRECSVTAELCIRAGGREGGNNKEDMLGRGRHGRGKFLYCNNTDCSPCPESTRSATLRLEAMTDADADGRATRLHFHVFQAHRDDRARLRLPRAGTGPYLSCLFLLLYPERAMPTRRMEHFSHSPAVACHNCY